MRSPAALALVVATLFAFSPATAEASAPARNPLASKLTRTTTTTTKAEARAARRSSATAAIPGLGRSFVGPNAATSIPDGAGGTYVVWTSDRDGDSDVYLLRVTSAGAPAAGWPAGGLPVCTAPGHQAEAGMLSDGAGGVLVGWADYRNRPLITVGGAPDLYVQRVNSAGAPQWTANGILALQGPNFGGDLSAAVDGSGGAFFVWATAPPGDVYANHVDGSGTVPSGWSTDGVVVCDDPNDQYWPSIAADGGGGCYVTWEDARGVEYESYAQHMNASAVAQWTTNGVALTGGLEGYEPSVCSDGSGGMIACWFTTTDVIAQRYNSGGTAQWTPGGESIGTSSFTAEELWVWPDGSGGAYVNWRDPSLSTTLYAQHVNNAGAAQWDAAGVVVCNSPGDRYVEDGLVEAGGGLTLLWEDENPGGRDLYVGRVDAGGTAVWGTGGVTVCAAPGDQRPVAMAPDGSGGIVATWADYRHVFAEPYVQRVSSSGIVQLTASGQRVAADPGSQRFAIVVGDGSGGTWTVWHQKVGDDYDLRAKRLGSDGSPITGTVSVCSVAGLQLAGGVVPDGSGGIVIGWEDHRSGAESDLYAQHLDASGAAQWTADGVVVCNAPGDQSELRMIADGAGSAILAWTDERTGPQDVYAQRLGAAGAGLWGANGVAVCTMAGQQFSPVLALSGTGGAIVTWMDSRSLLAPTIYGQRLDSAGSPQWPANGLGLDATGGFIARCVDAATDGAGGTIVLFEVQNVDFFGTGQFVNTEVRASRFTSAGSSLWTLGGVLLTGTDAWREGERLVSDGAGGAIVAWSEATSGPGDIVAQRVNDLGALQWGNDGLTLCNAASWQWLSGIANDGAGGGIFTWTDQRSGLADVYAQRVNAGGTPQWTANGVAVVSAARGQYEAAVAADAGSATIAWTDFRNGTERLLYAQRLNAAGTPQWTSDGVTAALFSMVSSEARPGLVRITWAVSGADEVTAWRRVEDGAWESLGTLALDGQGRVTLEDTNVEPGERYAYRLVVPSAGGTNFGPEVWIVVPRGLALAIEGAYPSPARGDVWMAFMLPSSAPASIEVLDVAGRRVGGRELAAHEAGRHTLRLDEVPGHAGVYFVRLRQGGALATTTVVRAP